MLASLCNQQIQIFLDICKDIQFPVALEKTFWSSTTLTFLGLLIDTDHQLVLLLKEKIICGRQIIAGILNKTSRKVTVKELQQLCGFLNFLGRAIVPGRAFTRRLYAYTKSPVLKTHHHVKVNREMRLDLLMWEKFLHSPEIFSRPFIDFNDELVADKLDMYSDVSKNPELGFGATCGSSWMFSQWSQELIRCENPSIEYLELYALVAGFLAWGYRFVNRRIILFCDNMSVVEMVNSTSSTCRNCMVLIRILVLESLLKNVAGFREACTREIQLF